MYDMIRHNTYINTFWIIDILLQNLNTKCNIGISIISISTIYIIALLNLMSEFSLFSLQVCTNKYGRDDYDSNFPRKIYIHKNAT